MNTSRTIVRLDAEQHAVELEVMTPHHNPRIEGLEPALRRIGIRAVRTIELSTPRHRVTRTRLAELDGSKLDATRVMQVLRAVRNRELNRPLGHSFRAA